MIRLRKGVALRLWEDLLLAVITEAFADPLDVTGIFLSVRAHEDILSVWHADASNAAVVAALKSVYHSLNLTEPES